MRKVSHISLIVLSLILSTSCGRAKGLFHIPGTKFAVVNAGINHSCGITTKGSLMCWGDNTFFQLGDGTSLKRLVGVVPDSSNTYVSVSAGGGHSCGVTSNGDVKCWGVNPSGQLGDNTTNTSNIPVTVFDPGINYIFVSAGNNHTCGITDAMDLRCWGEGGDGALGNGGLGDLSVPTVTSVVTTYFTVSAGDNHTCAIEYPTLELKCWGENGSGQIGTGNFTDQPSPQPIDLGTPFFDVSVGLNHTCAIEAYNNRMWCWGDNTYGQLGDGTVVASPDPILVNDTSRFRSVNAEGDTTCGITTGGVLKCWGDNTYGQLGDGTKTGRLLPRTITNGNANTQISRGGQHTCALAGEGDLLCWGENGSGQLGTGTLIDETVPVLSN